jgi:hypothetical protein
MIISWKTRFALIAARNFPSEKGGLMWKEMPIEEF